MNLTDSNYKPYTIFVLVLIGISTLFAYSFFKILGEHLGNLPTILQIVVSIPSVPTIYAGLFAIFNKYLWKWSFFRYVGIITADNLNGTWKGVIKSSWDNFTTDIPAELTIKQTATSIKIYGKFNQSQSVSIHEHFGKNPINNQTTLYYFYKNDPNYNAPSTMAMHEGSTILTYDKGTKILSGYYYSGRDRHNHGTIEVIKI